MTPEDYAAASRMWNNVKELDLPKGEKEWVYQELDNNLTAEEKELKTLTESVLDKLHLMNDYAFSKLNPFHNIDFQ